MQMGGVHHANGRRERNEIKRTRVFLSSKIALETHHDNEATKMQCVCSTLACSNIVTPSVVINGRFGLRFSGWCMVWVGGIVNNTMKRMVDAVLVTSNDSSVVGQTSPCRGRASANRTIASKKSTGVKQQFLVRSTSSSVTSILDL